MSILPRLIDAATTLNQQRAWTEGWKAVQSIMFFDHRAKADDVKTKLILPELAKLRHGLAPTELLANIRTYLAGNSHDMWSLDPDFVTMNPKIMTEPLLASPSLSTGSVKSFPKPKWWLARSDKCFSLPIGHLVGMPLALV